MADIVFKPDSAAMNELLSGTNGPVAKLLLRKVIRGESAAKRLCPVDTGRLRSSITHKLDRDGNDLYGAFGTDVSYALFVELGTKRMSARPYLRPALTEAASQT